MIGTNKEFELSILSLKESCGLEIFLAASNLRLSELVLNCYITNKTKINILYHHQFRFIYKILI